MPRPPGLGLGGLHVITDKEGERHKWYIEQRLPMLIRDHEDGSQSLVLKKDLSVVAHLPRQQMNVWLSGIAFGLHAAKEFEEAQQGGKDAT